MARINRAARPSRITRADLARQAAHLAEIDRRAASARRVARVQRLAYWAAVVAMGVWIFYGITN